MVLESDRYSEAGERGTNGGEVSTGARFLYCVGRVLLYGRDTRHDAIESLVECVQQRDRLKRDRVGVA